MTNEEAIESLNGCIVSEEYKNGKANGNVTCDLTREVLGMAIDALREKQERDNPQPLTLDELREASEQNEFCGAHIWIKDLDCGWIAAAITDRTTQDGVVGIWCVDTNEVFREKDYGKTWLAYRYEPKEAANG